MTRSFALVAGVFVTSVAFSGTSFAQSRPSDATLDSYVVVSPYAATNAVASSPADMRAQRINDLSQQTTDGGRRLTLLDAAPQARSLRPTARDQALESVYDGRDSTTDVDTF